MRPTELVISLSVIEDNYRALRAKIPQDVKTMAVVKADAYGHGLVPVARRLEKAGVDMFAVALLEEAVALRRSGIVRPILVLGGILAEDAGEAVRWDVSPAVYDDRVLMALEEAAVRQGTAANAHLKVDTGMSRVGVQPGRELTHLLGCWRDCPSVHMQGAFTHFAAAGSDAYFTHKQDAAFRRALDDIRYAGFSPIAHEAATEACLKDEYQLDMVRLGIGLYGYLVPELAGKIKMAQLLRTRPVRIDSIRAGETVSYGRTFRAQRDTRVMTVPIGYGDGYPRLLSNRAEALVHGVRVPVIGRVCMDMLMLDVTDVTDVCLTDEVVLLGPQGADAITAEELAEYAETIPYEILLGFTDRVRRVFVDEI